MNQPAHYRTTCARIAEFLEYPTADFREQLKNLSIELDQVYGERKNYLKEFYSKMKRMDLAMWQEFYVQTFDLLPSCCMYISVHLFGEENFKRAELMSGLKSIYESRGGGPITELPDHLAVILKQNACLDDEEWRELNSYCLSPALKSMIQQLEKNNNPYALLLKSVKELLIETEKVHV